TLEARLPPFFHSAMSQVRLSGLVATCVFRCLLSPSFLFPLPSLLAFLPALLLRFLIPPSFLPFPRPFPPSLFCLKADNSIQVVDDRHALCRFSLRPPTSDLFVSISAGFANSTGLRFGVGKRWEASTSKWTRARSKQTRGSGWTMKTLAIGYCSCVRRIVCGDWHCVCKHRTSYTSTHQTLPRAARGCIRSYQTLVDASSF
ncbi:hypothetical protein K438DRAFT_1876339, partial [Mycena galopus ATCC 62051]